MSQKMMRSILMPSSTMRRSIAVLSLPPERETMCSSGFLGVMNFSFDAIDCHHSFRFLSRETFPALYCYIAVFR